MCMPCNVFFKNNCDVTTLDHPQEDLTTFNYQPTMKVENN